MKKIILLTLAFALSALSQTVTPTGSKTALSGSTLDFTGAVTKTLQKKTSEVLGAACTVQDALLSNPVAGAPEIWTCTPSTGTACPCIWTKTTGSGVSGSYEPANSNIQAHILRTDNPHSATAAQVGAVALTAVGVANGVPSLGSDGKVPSDQLPTIAPGSGDVTGAASSTANTIPVFSNTTGKAIATSTVEVSSGQLRPPAGLRSGNGTTAGCVDWQDADRSNFRRICANSNFTADYIWNMPNSVPTARHVVGGTAPSSGASTYEYLNLTGTGVLLPTWEGATTTGRCVHTNASGNLEITAADCGTGGGSTTKDYNFQAALCRGANTPGPPIPVAKDLDDNGVGTYSCTTGRTYSRYGRLSFPEGGVGAATVAFVLPFNPSAISMEIEWETTVTNASLGAIFHSQSSFVAAGASNDPAWNTEPTPVRVAATTTANSRRVTTFSMPITGASNGAKANFVFWRDPNDGSDDLASDVFVRSVRIVVTP